MMLSHGPRRPELGPCSAQQQQWDGRALYGQHLEKLKSRRVNPVQVLDHNH